MHKLYLNQNLQVLIVHVYQEIEYIVHMYQEIKSISAFTTATETKPYLCSETHNNLFAMEMMQLLL